MKRSQTLTALAKNGNHFVTKEEVKHLLNGYARVIEFGTNHIDKKGNYNPTIDHSQNFVLQICEGQIRNGLLCGFSRIHDNEGECKVGYWNIKQFGPETIVSRPYGKFAHYFKDGSFRTPDGIYHGNDKVWNKMIRQKQNVDFMANEKPEGKYLKK